MGVNFYARVPGCGSDCPCPHCPGAWTREYHLGKSSVGWEFCWQGNKDIGVLSVADWRSWVEKHGATIVDECGITYTFDQILALASRKRGGHTGCGERRDPEGWRFLDVEFC